MKILLVNPPIFDFSAYDFWLKPFGMLTAVASFADEAELVLFDYLDRAGDDRLRSDEWCRGSFGGERVEKPAVFGDIPRYFRRFGKKREVFRRFLADHTGADAVLIQTAMTYWYPGVAEVIADVRELSPGAKVVLGGFYASCCPEHAKGLGADLVVAGEELGPLSELLGASSEPRQYRPPIWELYPKLDVGVMKLTRGCPFSCTYCTVSWMYPGFAHHELSECICDLEKLLDVGVANIAFYDDALLFEPKTLFEPFLQHVITNNIKVNFHTPNAMHARYVSDQIAELMVAAGFKTFYLGFESADEDFQRKTGAKVLSKDLVSAVENLLRAGIEPENIAAYQIAGHPHGKIEDLEASMRFVNSLGIRVVLSDFSPIPGTPDGDFCGKWTDLSEPLNHNKTAFPIRMMGNDRVNRLKDLCRAMNESIKSQENAKSNGGF